MLTLEQTQEVLDEIYDGIPPEISKDLNGGIILHPEAKMHPESLGHDLYTMGEYHRDLYFGRYIIIYYGSFVRTCGHLTDDEVRQKLKDVLYHEFTHHLESLAGDRSLEVEDAVEIEKYKRRYQPDKD